MTPSKIADKATHVKLSAILQKRPLSGAGRGTLFHLWLEQLTWLEDWKLSDEELRQTALSLPASELDLEACVKQFRTLLRRPQVAGVLSRSTYQKSAELPFSESVRNEMSRGQIEPELSLEQSFSVIDSGQAIQGTIDRLVLLRRDRQIVAARDPRFQNRFTRERR